MPLVHQSHSPPPPDIEWKYLSNNTRVCPFDNDDNDNVLSSFLFMNNSLGLFCRLILRGANLYNSTRVRPYNDEDNDILYVICIIH